QDENMPIVSPPAFIHRCTRKRAAHREPTRIALFADGGLARGAAPRAEGKSLGRRCDEIRGRKRLSDSTALKSAFEKALAMGQRIVGDGVKPGFAVFDQALRENLGVASTTKAGATGAAAPAVDKAKSSDGTAPAKDATQASADPNAPLLTGLQGLRGASKTQVL